MSAANPAYDDGDIRPVVATASQSKLGVYAFLAVLLIGGFALFSALSASRNAASAPRTTIPAGNSERITSPPPLILPRAMLGDDSPSTRLAERPVQPAPLAPPVPVRSATAPRATAIPAPAEQVFAPFTPVQSGPRVVFEQSNAVPSAQIAAQAAADGRVEAGRLANPSMTVPQGTVIPAVLETALDSTRPGGVRALVQRDIHSFDGSRILIHRGSRLYGTYAAGLNPGERRALIQWTRLVRPDGVTIALDSPASDPLGRAGVEGDVDSRFFARFGGAILQSVLDIGVGLATRQVSDGVIVALPGSTQNVSAATQSQQVQPVLKVDHGTSVSVFVARDLDFSSVEG